MWTECKIIKVLGSKSKLFEVKIEKLFNSTNLIDIFYLHPLRPSNIETIIERVTKI